MCRRIFPLLFALTIGPASSVALTAQADQLAVEAAVMQLQIVGRSGTTEGTCFLVHRSGHGNDAVLYFLTSARLFKGPDADWRGGQRIRILPPHHAPIEVAANHVVLPVGNVLDVAVIRVISSTTEGVPLPVVLEPPGPGGVFLIAGYHANGSPAKLTEQVRFRATLRIEGDRDASHLPGCAGAPAIDDRGVFGLVSECAVGRTPSITPLSVAVSFISRNVPGWAPDQSETP